MSAIHESFAKLYSMYIPHIRRQPVNITCRGREMSCEVTNVKLMFSPARGISVYSHADTRAFPIKFALAEFLWILAKRNDVASIARWNKNIVHYSDDTVIMNGAYGFRLDNQIENCILRLINDKHTRQACANIWQRNDSMSTSKDHPCNTFLQFMIRDETIDLTVTSRSSDFVTGLPIDSFHWQMLLVIVRNELLSTYPTLRIGNVIYNIASLHVYDVDKEALDLFYTVDDYERVMYLPPNITFSKLTTNAMKSFHTAHDFADLLIMYSMPVGSMNIACVLHETFLARRHKFNRGGTQA